MRPFLAPLIVSVRYPFSMDNRSIILTWFVRNHSLSIHYSRFMNVVVIPGAVSRMVSARRAGIELERNGTVSRGQRVRFA